MSHDSPAQLPIPHSLTVAQKVANLADTAVRIPFTNFRVGLDFLVGLIPGIGDAIMFVVAVSIVMMGRSLGVPKSIQLKMIRNSIADFLLGLIPLVGDVIDMFYKSNQANVRLMERWWLQQHKAQLDQNTQQQLQDWKKSVK